LRFLEQLAAHGGRVAVVSDALELDYAALADRVDERRRQLLDAGIGETSVAALEVADEIDNFVSTLALLAAGARQVALFSHDPSPAKSALAAQAGATHHVIAAGAVSGVDAVPASPIGEGVVYLKTSGTTGEANIIAFTETQIAAQSGRHPEYASERLLRLASIEHNTSKRHRLYCAFAGGTNVFRSALDTDIASFCQRHAVTCLDISRMHASDLASMGGLGRFTGVKLRPGGSAVPIDLRRALEQRVTPLLYVRYASTESGAIAMAGPGEHDESETVGRPLPGVDLQIVGTDDLPLPPGEIGRIRLKAAGMATGYVNNPEQTAQRFRDGWFWPGDLGLLREDGSLIVKGRADDMIILNGINVFPAEIESVLERHPAVATAAAAATRSPVHGDIPVAAVELRLGHSVEPLELMAFARQQLSLRTPRRIVIVESLPRNAHGKLLRRAIPELAKTELRQVIADAMVYASVPGFADSQSEATFRDGTHDVKLTEVDIDSLAAMELCIALELSTGVSLAPADITAMTSLGALLQRLEAGE
jgi:long-chain acyl-CoA synthetase